MVLLHSMDALVAIPLGGIILALSAFLLAREELKSCILTSISFPISIASRRVKAWRFLLDGPNIIQAGYDKVSVHPIKRNNIGTELMCGLGQRFSIRGPCSRRSLCVCVFS
ncbi:hypothetical protein H113_04240 [Trichophyton rubrum MR1459]|uniref:Uncharacterized protein n=1 Tax=Trichophyton rubrum (strain ATCC MYA-4607 / CBS 118892) TaxID=559305 RepID=A0A080WTF3_TRIRC|nr:uncharacterized protein TERG_12088 [Trichophyton rubrum CBS 118892]EZF95410.1 hypothetical protein H113_04240 [Trichophyton rubrum MR1459]EZG06238.1 hypothetical protein H106_04023 [Trichophyton rubrum CBS 735.88]KFL61438.1 hypothetical protein TERG_12088 [Trichophyton rubrum CBS 118892]